MNAILSTQNRQTLARRRRSGSSFFFFLSLASLCLMRASSSERYVRFRGRLRRRALAAAVLGPALGPARPALEELHALGVHVDRAAFLARVGLPRAALQAALDEDRAAFFQALRAGL